ncbi:cAMP-mediated signaling protein Sok1 [Metarhizium album ARSEF 1941]|uniref:cAMP-mediated signaling protein Sok1 n=1 Tax=Metarhizium album (strain ARSEF 1941) TaxID=1081103 RepID=A0A0B2X848_METAS|nr:cAMP-mediated signaling protein Sok1 [Metarhizium album ARSEF 1941]KHO01943.1 cAMP-mediated signaling protein Sok1 [Metarhizium album ARSEF 1941]
MVPEQDTGGHVERSRRNLSTSAPGPNNETEQIQDADVQMQQAPQDETQSSKKAQSTSQESPRRCDPALRSSTPAPSVLSGSSSSTSPSSSPTPEPSVTRRSRRHSLHQSLPLEPPVTKSTLSELDVSKIIHNPKLRHDINFDPELHFRPNLDGEKGRKKQERANQFWRALKEELTQFITDRPAFYAKHGETDDWTLPSLLKAVKEIIQTLVPQRDRQFLDEGFNIELLMQQFHKGIADLEKLALWLSQVLKSHCAPMRDDWVDTMYTQLSEGNRDSDLDQLVTGMRSLLSVLEAMKLDVANHQIRCLRPVLIEDTTHFEQKFFLKKIQSGKVDITGAREWYREFERSHSATLINTTQTFGDMGVFFEALSRLVLPSSGEKRVPSTFLFDEERIMKLRSDMVDVINLDICMRMYEDLERVARYSSKMLGRDFQPLDEDTFNSSTTPSSELNLNTPLSNSRPSSLVFSSSSSASSSPRSSLVMPSYVAPENCESRIKARNVYNSLVALLQSTPPSSRHCNRWQTIAPSMALQIFRYTNAPSELLPTFEGKLIDNVCRADSQIYKEVEQAFHNRLMSALAGRVRDYKALSGVSLFALATGGRVASNNRLQLCRVSDSSRDGQDEGGVEDMATRLAHLGVLHWRVWGQLAYLGEPEDMSVDVPGNI